MSLPSHQRMSSPSTAKPSSPCFSAPSNSRCSATGSSAGKTGTDAAARLDLRRARLGHGQGGADAALRQRRQPVALAVAEIGAMAPEEFRHDRHGERLQGQAAAARADGRQQPPGRVADQQQQRLLRGLLQHLQQRVGGVAVERVGLVDDDDAPAALRRRLRQEGADGADVVDDDLLAQPLAPVVEAALDGEQVGVAAAGDPAEDRALGWNGKVVRRRAGGPWAGEEEAGEAEGERGLADAAGAGEQPGMRQPARCGRGEQGALRRLLAEQLGVHPRRRPRLGGGLRGSPRAHRATRGGTGPRRARTCARSSAATASGDPLASTTTQRSGSSRAMARKPSRTRWWKPRSIRS